MDALALLKLQVDWGADEALDVAPRDRLSPAPKDAPAVHVKVDLGPAAAPERLQPAGALARAEAAAAAARDLAGLREALAGFADCPLRATAIHLMFDDGAGASGVMAIGDSPGEEEDRSGIPFSGPGGRLLERMLASISLSRADIRFAYAIPWRPPGNRKPSDHERALYRPFLHRQIALTQPRAVLLLGAAATASLIPGTAASLRRLRGVWQTVTLPGLAFSMRALPTAAPDHLLAAPATKKEAWADMLRLRIALDSLDAGQP